MYKGNFSLQLSLVSTAFGIIAGYFGDLKVSYIILLILVAFDTVTGITAAIKYRRFSSKGLYNFIKKSIYYTICIIVIRLVEIVITSIVKTTMLSHIIVVYLAIMECVSVLENLTVLGAPIPTKLIKQLINGLNIPGTNLSFNIDITNNKEISEIDDIIRNQLPAFTEGDLRKLLEINFREWQSILLQIYTIEEFDSDNKDVFYYKIMSILEVGLKDRGHQFKDSNISKEEINKFYQGQKVLLDKCMQKIKNTCYRDHKINDKKEEIIDSIMILLYETLMNGHRNKNKE